MKPEEHLNAIKYRLTQEKAITDYRIIREQFTARNAQIRVRATFSDNSILEFSEFVRLTNQDALDLVAYSYHWMDAGNQLRVRWDNAEHYPDLPGFPHHLHDGEETSVIPGEPVNLFKVLDLIAERLKQV